ncbi:WD repeat-containing protein 55 [Carcharodon carcharias]|uniref:WD repeat-containing protein 55 n=1 Tax=Carcharodon carcharias TaxID=13397 RepID=UPI001B7DA73C|nr:WD repeat-containing protein 55 [Carcharodon carcharias]
METVGPNNPNPAVKEAQNIQESSGIYEAGQEAALTNEDHSEDEEVKEARVRETPEDITFDAIVNTIAFHPTRDVIAAGDVDGDVYVVSYSCEESGNQELWSSGHHLKSCRQLAFTPNGQELFTVSKDKSIHILNVERGKLVTKIPKAHSAAINSLKLIDENLFATGDDDGLLKVWDLRKETSFMEMKNHDDYISDITIDQNKKILLTTSGDGTMCVFNIKRRRFDLQSEFQDGDLTSLAIMKRGSKVVCSSTEGMIYLFNWDGFGATSDRFLVPGESIDCIVPITDNILCTASMDGVIRAVNIFPNRVIGSVGQHIREPIEQIAKSSEGRFLASCAHDQKVKFWDISDLRGVVIDDYRRRKKHGKLKSLSRKAFGCGSDFFADLAEGSEEEEGEEHDSESE